MALILAGLRTPLGREMVRLAIRGTKPMCSALSLPLGPSSMSARSVREVASVSLTKPATRDPERPVQPTTPWLRFLAEFRAQEKRVQGGAAIMSAASAKWKGLSVTERQPFEDGYAAERRTYDEKFKEYVDSGKRDAWRRDPAKPKRPMTGYMLFAQEFRSKNSSLKMTETTKMAATQWKGMSETERAMYNSRYVDEKAKYETAIREYKASGKEMEWQTKVGITGQLEKVKAALEKKKAAAAKKKTAAKEKLEAKKLKAAEKKKAAVQKKKAALEKSKLALAKKKLAQKAQAKAAKEKAKAMKEKKKATLGTKNMAKAAAAETKPKAAVAKKTVAT